MDNNFGRLERSKLSGAVSDVIKSIDERLECYLFHVFIKRLQAALFVERKGNSKIGQALFPFDLSEDYPVVPQGQIQSRYWDHTSCTLVTAIVHFKDTKDNLLKKKPFIIVSDYMNCNKYAVSKFLDVIFDEFSKSQPELSMNSSSSVMRQLSTLNKNSLFTMMLIDGNVVWYFSATCHGKGDIDGLGDTCKHRVCEKTLARTTYPQNSIDFAKCAAAVLPRITILHCSTTDVEEMKAALDNS